MSTLSLLLSAISCLVRLLKPRQTTGCTKHARCPFLRHGFRTTTIGSSSPTMEITSTATWAWVSLTPKRSMSCWTLTCAASATRRSGPRRWVELLPSTDCTRYHLNLMIRDEPHIREVIWSRSTSCLSTGEVSSWHILVRLFCSSDDFMRRANPFFTRYIQNICRWDSLPVLRYTFCADISRARFERRVPAPRFNDSPMSSVYISH